MNKNSGMTLIETVMYLGLLSFLMIALVPWLFELDTWRVTLNSRVSEIDTYLYTDGVISGLIRDGEAISEGVLGSNFWSLNITTEQWGNQPVLVYWATTTSIQIGSTSKPTFNE